MQIRLAREADVPGILEIYRPYIENTAITFEYEVPTLEAFYARFREITARCPWLVALEDGELLGYAYADRAFVRAAYSWAADFSVYLRQDCRGKGLGSKFYELLERMTAMQGYQVVYGLVTSENEASRRFHQALGYRETALLPACGFKLGAWHGVYWYEKRLCAAVPPEAMPTAAPEMDWSRLELPQWPGVEIQL